MFSPKSDIFRVFLEVSGASTLQLISLPFSATRELSGSQPPLDISPDVSILGDEVAKLESDRMADALDEAFPLTRLKKLLLLCDGVWDGLSSTAILEFKDMAATLISRAETMALFELFDAVGINKAVAKPLATLRFAFPFRLDATLFLRPGFRTRNFTA